MPPSGEDSVSHGTILPSERAPSCQLFPSGPCARALARFQCPATDAISNRSILEILKPEDARVPQVRNASAMAPDACPHDLKLRGPRLPEPSRTASTFLRGALESVYHPAHFSLLIRREQWRAVIGRLPQGPTGDSAVRVSTAMTADLSAFSTRSHFPLFRECVVAFESLFALGGWVVQPTARGESAMWSGTQTFRDCLMQSNRSNRPLHS